MLTYMSAVRRAHMQGTKLDTSSKSPYGVIFGAGQYGIEVLGEGAGAVRWT